MNNSMIKILIGISGSGKSTIAHQMWEDMPNDVIITNRDNIRNLLFGYNENNVNEYYSRKDFSTLEKQVTLYENSVITNALSSGKTVVADNTHLDWKYIEKYQLWNVPIELIWVNCEVNEAIRRDELRTGQVGSEIITKQWHKYNSLKLKYKGYKFNVSSPIQPDIIEAQRKRHCVIYDLDGTLAYKCDRNIYDYSKVGGDICNRTLANILGEMEIGYKPIFCSGRSEECYEETLQWISDNIMIKRRNISLYMRKSNDYRPDWIVKEELWREIAESYYIHNIFDDRDVCVIRGRALGLEAYQVNYGFF